MLEKLGNVLKKATDKIANAIFLDKNLVDTIVRELQRALIEADVSIALVKDLSDKLRKAAFDERVKNIEKKEHLIKILHDELEAMLGEKKELELEKGQNRIMFLGLYGAGKTTTIAKLGNYFQKRSKKVALVGLDVHRPAAAEQLAQNAKKHNLTAFTNTKEKDALALWKSVEPKLKTYDVVFIDTAGRHMLDKELITEIKALDKTIKPTNRILVIPADVGQAAKKQAQEFKEAVNVSGVIVTRMDSTAKGGGALTACKETNAPIYFIATGEKINDIEEFAPKQFLSRLLGMGDLTTLLEKIKSATGEKEQQALQEKLSEGKLTLTDVVEQVKSMNTMGGFGKIKSMIPGLGNAKISDDALQTQQEKVAKWEHIINSMTPYEKENPQCLKTQHSRITRIAKGAGVNNSDIKSLLKQYDMLQTFIKDGADMSMEKGLDQKKLMKLAKKFGKKKMMRL